MPSAVIPLPGSLQLAQTTKTTNANNTTASILCFRVTGTVRVTKLYGVVTTVIGANHTAGFFRLNDQTAQPAITLAAGITLSAAPVGTFFGKFGLVTAIALLSTSAAGRIIEPTALETLEYTEFQAIQKTGGVQTDIEYRYSTTDAPASGAIQFFAEWQQVSGDGLLLAL